MYVISKMLDIWKCCVWATLCCGRFFFLTRSGPWQLKQFYMLDVDYCCYSTLTHNIHFCLGGLGATAVGARDLVLSMVPPHGLLDEQSAIFALCIHDHPLLVNFAFIFGPFDFWLGSTGHHGGKLKQLTGFDDDTILHGSIKFHSRSFWSTWITKKLSLGLTYINTQYYFLIRAGRTWFYRNCKLIFWIHHIKTTKQS